MTLTVQLGKNWDTGIQGHALPVSLTNGIDWEADWRGSVYPVKVLLSFKPAVAAKLRSQRTAKWEDSNAHCCAYYCYDGDCFWTNWDIQKGSSSEWQGREGLGGSGTVGLLLDLK